MWPQLLPAPFLVGRYGVGHQVAHGAHQLGLDRQVPDNFTCGGNGPATDPTFGIKRGNGQDLINRFQSAGYKFLRVVCMIGDSSGFQCLIR